MGSTNYLSKSKNGFRTKSGSSVGSDKELNGKMRRSKIRRPAKMTDYGMKRIPDYTELAYKEAVSKLRYFLSGNYAPSVRSYGSPASIKNLDESDLDTDKKYGSMAYPTALSEYKPRPRLTTKYATLYADSLKNYSPVSNLNTATPAPAPVADITGGTNPDVVHFIQKQEEYIEQLERESQYCRDELNNLLGKVKEVITENEHLHEAQKNKLISRMFHSYNTAGSETDELDDIGDSTGLDSDSKPIPLKTKRATKTRSTRLEGPNIVFESRISELEAQLAQSKIDLKKVQDENNENKRKLANGLVDSTYLDGFKRQIDNLQRDKNSLESQISKLKLSLEQKDGDFDLKYKRADDFDHLREERNNLEAEVRRMKDELANERGKIRELAGEGARRVIQERSAAEQRYTAHFDELANDLAAQYDSVAKLQLDLERQRREENDLKRELSSKNTTIEELKMELKNKSSNLHSDLSHVHAEKSSLEEELANARLALERQQRQSKHETNRLNSEIQSLRQRLDRADADLVHSRRENLRLSEQIAALEKELNMKNLTPLSPEKNKKEKELTTVLESMENKHAQTVAELESMIHSQNDLMEKLTGECRLLTDKLDDVNRRHKAQSRSRTDEPIRTQRDASKARDRRSHRSSKCRCGKESDSSNSQPPIVVGPLTTSQDLTETNGEQVYNLPLMIQQPFLHEKKEPIKVDISVKLVPRSKKKDKKRKHSNVIIKEAVDDDRKAIENFVSMEISNGNVNVLKQVVTETTIDVVDLEKPNNNNDSAVELIKCEDSDIIKEEGEPNLEININEQIEETLNEESVNETGGIIESVPEAIVEETISNPENKILEKPSVNEPKTETANKEIIEECCDEINENEEAKHDEIDNKVDIIAEAE